MGSDGLGSHGKIVKSHKLYIFCKNENRYNFFICLVFLFVICHLKPVFRMPSTPSTRCARWLPLAPLPPDNLSLSARQRAQLPLLNGSKIHSKFNHSRDKSEKKRKFSNR